jgi:hypothetical protein
MCDRPPLNGKTVFSNYSYFSIKINKISKVELYEIHKACCGQNDGGACYFQEAMIKLKYMYWFI